MRNAWRCYVSYALSLLGSVRIVHKPIFVSVEPASVCQLHCPECPVGRAQLPDRSAEKKQPFMPVEVYRRVLAEVKETAWVMQFYFQGEPILHNALPQMIGEAHDEGLYTIVSTNAQAMTAEMAEALIAAGLSRIIISMDGLTQESYEAYRIGGSVEKCKEALRLLRAAKERLHGRTVIELQVLRLRSNEHEWKAFEAQYKALGADRLVFKTAQLYDYEDGHPLMPTDERYSRYVKDAEGHYHRRSLRPGCMRVWSGIVVTTTGEVLPCCYDKAHAHAYGNIMRASLADLFGNEKANTFRQSALLDQPQICKECYK